MMDTEPEQSSSPPIHHIHHNLQQTIVAVPRPTIPPKPKSSSSSVIDAIEIPRRRTTNGNTSTATVGTQVNLLVKRKSKEQAVAERNSELQTPDPISPVPSPKLDGDSQIKSRLSIGPGNKPALPPKPSSATLASPRKTPVSTSEAHNKTTEPILSIKPPARKTQAPYASIDELENLSDPPSHSPNNKAHSILQNTRGPINPPPATLNSNRLILSPSISQEPQNHNVFQYPSVLLPQSGLTPNQRIQAQRKCTSLGRNIVFSPPTSPFFRVSHLDLTSSSRFGTRMLSQQNFEAPSSIPPPPPPRRRNSHKPQSSPGLDVSLASPLSLPSSPNSAPIIFNPPVYAAVDKEKKWEMRRLKEKEEKLNNNIFIPENNNGIELSSEKSNSDVGNRNSFESNSIQCQSEVLSPQPEPQSPLEPKSWLGKFIAQNSGDAPSPSLDLTLLANPGSHSTHEEPNSPPGANSSFLFTQLNNTIENEVEEKPSEENENVESKSQKDGINNAPIQLSPSLSRKEECEKDVEIRTEELTSQRKTSGIIYDKNNDSPEEPDAEIEKDEDAFEKLLEEKLEPVFLVGVTEGESTIDNVDAVGAEAKSPSDADLISEIVRSQEQFKSPTKKLDGEPKRRAAEAPEAVLPELVPPSSFRRRSWTCSENTSSFTESSPSSSSSSSLRERRSSISGSINSPWVDEGDLSTGALGDAENSDAGQGGSIEDFSPNSRPGGSGSFSRRRRLVNSFFASFGKTGGLSSASGERKGGVVMRVPPGGKRKEKSRSHFFLESTHPMKGKKIKSEVYCGSRGYPPIRSCVHKMVSAPQLPFQNISIPPEGESSGGPLDSSSTDHRNGNSKPSPRNSVDSTIVSSNCYDEILLELSPKEQKPFRVAREILTSERTFVKVLNLLTVDFPSFLKDTEERLGHPIISKADFDFLLGGLPNLKLVNQSLVHDLEERISSWKLNPRVSDIIIKTGPFLKHYSTYIRDYQKIFNRFELIRTKNLQFGRTVAEFEKLGICKNLQLKHYMLKPVQRMPQYALLLGDYLKNLSQEEDGDYEDTVKAISIVKEVAEHGNEAIRLQENAEKLVQLQNRLSQNVILKADRQLICEGELRKVCRKELQPRYFALMSDCLLCMIYAGSGTATGSKEFRLRYELPLTGMRVALPNNEDYQNEFSVISVTRSFNLVAKTPKERDDWLKALNLAIKNNIKRRAVSANEVEKQLTEIGKVAPVWTADSRVTMCQACTAEFTMTFRRHHCRACGKVVCGHCSGNEAPIQYQNFEAARVCDDCFMYLQEEFDRENQQNTQEEISVIRARFKKGTPSISKKATKHKRSIPHRLEVHGNISGSSMSGYLQWKEHRKAWKRQWFVLFERVLYAFAASEDIAAIRSIPILGYQVELVSGGENLDGDEGVKSIFQLTHSGQDPYIFQAESNSSAEKWIAAMQEATVLK